MHTYVLTFELETLLPASALYDKMKHAVELLEAECLTPELMKVDELFVVTESVYLIRAA